MKGFVTSGYGSLKLMAGDLRGLLSKLSNFHRISPKFGHFLRILYFQEWVNADYIMNEIRYKALKVRFPDRAGKLYKLAEEDAKFRYDTFKRLAK